MPSLLVSHRYKFVYVPIPKVGSTGFKEWLCRLEGVSWQPDYVHEAVRALSLTGTIPRGYFTFAFVRNPWTRLASAFKANKRAVRRRVGRAAISFDQFVACLVAAGDLTSEDLHWRPQWTFLKGVPLDFVGRLEDLQRVWPCIRESLGVGGTLPRHPRRSLRFVGTEGLSLYTSILRARVGELYARDVALFEGAGNPTKGGGCAHT